MKKNMKNLLKLIFQQILTIYNAPHQNTNHFIIEIDENIWLEVNDSYIDTYYNSPKINPIHKPLFGDGNIPLMIGARYNYSSGFSTEPFEGTIVDAFLTKNTSFALAISRSNQIFVTNMSDSNHGIRHIHYYLPNHLHPRNTP